MKVTFALIPNIETQNFVIKLAWEIHTEHNASLAIRCLPPHISLKQPFNVSSLDDLTNYMQEFAASIPEMNLTLDGYQVWDWPNAYNPTSSILTIKTQETSELRALHTRLNRELTARFGDCSAQFDGDAYSFHLSVIGGGATPSQYQNILKNLDSKNLPTKCDINQLAMFVYDDPNSNGEWVYTTYKIMPLDAKVGVR